MYDTTVMLKARNQWRAGMTYEKLIGEMDAKLQFPGLSNTWTMPVENRLDMQLTGIKTPIGLKIQGRLSMAFKPPERRWNNYSPGCRMCAQSLRRGFRKASISTWKLIVPRRPVTG